MLAEMVQRRGRVRFYLSKLYFLVKILSVKLRTLTLQPAWTLIEIQQKSNQICEGRIDGGIYQNVRVRIRG